MTRSVLDVFEHQHLELMCTVQGGNPVVSSTLLTCDVSVFLNHTLHVHSTNGDHVTIAMVVTKRLHKMRCFCSAVHVTGMYKLESYVTFLVKCKLFATFL